MSQSMEAVTLKVWADYVCPWCYLGQVAAQRLQREYTVTLEWQPFQLRPDAPETGWPLPEAIRARMNRPDSPLGRRAAALGLPLVERGWIPSSRRALQCDEHVRAVAPEALDRFHAAVNHRYWAKGDDLSHWPTLEAAAKDAGLDPAAMRDAVEAGACLEPMQRGLAEAAELGIHGVPAYVFFRDGQPVGALSGAQEWAVFERVAAQLKLPRR
jgi:predicted DsbA family dithiol-disulfide isomerase